MIQKTVKSMSILLIFSSSDLVRSRHTVGKFSVILVPSGFSGRLVYFTNVHPTNKSSLHRIPLACAMKGSSDNASAGVV